MPTPRSKSNSINLFYQNVRGLKTKLRTLRNNLHLIPHDLVAITETYLDDSVGDAELTDRHWSVHRRDRKSPCGGVLLAARSPITLHRRPELETDCGEDLWTSFTWHGSTCFICVVYIKPKSTDFDYIRFFCKVESFINDLKAPVLILGDLNLNSASLSILNYYCYFLSYCSLSEKNAVNNVHGGKLDVVLIQEGDKLYEVSVEATEGLVPIDLYHPPLDIVVKTTIPPRSSPLEPSNIDPATDYNFRKCDWISLYHLLSLVSWNSVLECTDVNAAVQNFYSILYNIFDCTTPKKRRKNSKTKRYPVWFTSDIIKDAQLKLKKHAIWKRTKCTITYKQFSGLRADLKVRIAHAYTTYTTSVENGIKDNPKDFWRHISSLRTKGGFEPDVTYLGKTYSDTQAAEAFASFFSSVFQPDLPLLDSHKAICHDSSWNSNFVSIPEITHDDVFYGLRKLKPGSSVGPDSIPPSMMKHAKNQLCSPLHHIFNLVLESGVYPKSWKISRVKPIPKSSNKSSVEEYRPIAIMSSPAKVFESILQKYLFDQVNIYLCNEQHGFRSKRSVDTNLLTLVSFISTRLDKGCQVDVLYFDFKKAFDRVNNDILLAKLVTIGFAPKILHLIADYLRDRQQYVRLGVYESRPYHTRSGVSQGSILGPLLFLIMINDIPSVLKTARCLLYADDLKLYREIKSESDSEALQGDVDAIYQWSVVNNMEFNISKCCIMTFGRMRNPILFNYTLDHASITRKFEIKDLGVTFDAKLTFNPHIAALATECYKRLGFVLRNAKDFKNIQVIKLLFSALVRSKLETAACVWNPHEASYTLSLEKVQKAFLRYLYKRLYGYYPYMYPTKFLLGCLGYNSLEVRRIFDQMVIALKILRGGVDCMDLSDELCKFFTPNNYTRSRKHKLLLVPTCRTVSHAQSPVPRVLTYLNTLLDVNPECDLFADEWKELLSVCLKFCEDIV